MLQHSKHNLTTELGPNIFLSYVFVMEHLNTPRNFTVNKSLRMRDVTMTEATSKFSIYNYNNYFLKIKLELHFLNKVSRPYFLLCFLPSLVFFPSNYISVYLINFYLYFKWFRQISLKIRHYKIQSIPNVRALGECKHIYIYIYIYIYNFLLFSLYSYIYNL